MQHYYTNLPKNKDLDFATNQEVTAAIMRNAQDAFKPFEEYLKNTIEAQNKKADVKAAWKKMKNVAELSLIGELYEIPKMTVLEVKDNIEGFYFIQNEVDEPDFSEKIKYKIGKDKYEMEITENDYAQKKLFIPQTNETLSRVNWGADTLTLSPDWTVFAANENIEIDGNTFTIFAANDNKIEIQGIFEGDFFTYKEKKYEIKNIANNLNQKPNNATIVKDESHRFVMYADKNPSNLPSIPAPKIIDFIEKDNLYFTNGTKLVAEHNEELTFMLQTNKDYNKEVSSNGIKFKIQEVARNNKEAYWIQLLEKEETEEEIPGLSPLRYFFDDDITITDDKGNEYNIVEGKESENKLILKNKKEILKYSFPPSDSLLIVKVNIYNLEKQLQAIEALKKTPVREQAKLIKLFEKKGITWETPEKIAISDWAVLKSDTRSGAAEQRKFVNQALATPDFAILEGPPGSGKTTVILELICQLAQQGKKVLLCGSTHVAIDNVLERLKERKESVSLIEKYSILPVRIGDEKRINQDIKEFQIKELVEKNKISENLLLDIANLVCGTTIGILQHPHFKKRNKWSGMEPIIPEFDYLIIDESSKTTFQEFLVPALYAKKWILAGDVMQLSPFTDRAEIVANLEKIVIDKKNNIALPQECQEAIFYLYKIKESLFSKNKFIVPVAEKVMEYIISELEQGRIKDFDKKLICFIAQKEKEITTENLFSCTATSINTLALAAIDIIFVERNELSKILPQMPETHIVLRDKSWESSQHAFSHNHYQVNHKSFYFKEKGREYKDSFEIKKEIDMFLTEKNWAEEIAWRIDREHQLRLLDKSKITNYQKAVEALLPYSFDKKVVENEINQIAAMAFPSILESLVQGIQGRKTKHETTISKGFGFVELLSRRSILKYQHRMHPDISAFPRQQFYKESEALLDLSQPKTMYELREWTYKRYVKRSIWIDVKGETRRNYNEKEAEVMLKELKCFGEYAKYNTQPEGHDWEVACLTFYKGQETKIRERLRQLTGNDNSFSNFVWHLGAIKINIKLHNVDKFQGHEADIVFLSMVQTKRDGFLDNPNRLNVAITRAKFQLVILGDYHYFAEKSRSEDLKELAFKTIIHT